MRTQTIPKNFFNQATIKVAQNLLGKKLVRKIGDDILSGIIIETEAYCGMGDSACHASCGKTSRNQVMFEEAGLAYVYLVYGMHHMFNVVCEEKENPCAVLIRAVLPFENVAMMKKNRKMKKNIADGPGKLCQALCIDRSLNNHDLSIGNKLWFEEYKNIDSKLIQKSKRIGIDYAEKKDREALLRFYIKPAVL